MEKRVRRRVRPMASRGARASSIRKLGLAGTRARRGVRVSAKSGVRSGGALVDETRQKRREEAGEARRDSRMPANRKMKVGLTSHPGGEPVQSAGVSSADVMELQPAPSREVV
jgi:hypothetical protein